MGCISRVLTSVLVWAMMIGGLVINPASAQTEVFPSQVPSKAPATTTLRRNNTATRMHNRRFRSDVRSRNVGPDSTVGGGRNNDLGNANSGLPRVPGAPSTSGDGSTGGH